MSESRAPFVILIRPTAAAQVRISGGISGTVSDQTGGVVPGATVQLKDEGTGNPRETITNDHPFDSPRGCAVAQGRLFERARFGVRTRPTVGEGTLLLSRSPWEECIKQC
jgi:hypothetical protein